MSADLTSPATGGFRALERGPIELRIRGGAMRPLLAPGDHVRLERKAPRRRDVALVRIEQRLVLHRLVRRRGHTWLVRDEAAKTSAWIHQDQIVGIATRCLRSTDPKPRWQRLGRQRWKNVRAQAGEWLRRSHE